MNHLLEQAARDRVVVLHESETGFSAARAMRDHNIGCVVVCDESGHLTGIVTDRDLVMRSICEGLDPGLTQLRYLMTPRPATVTQEQGIEHARAIMREQGVRRVPVVNSRGKAIGIITLDDLIALGPNEQPSAAAVIRKQNSQPARLNPSVESAVSGTAHARGPAPSPHSVSPEQFHEMIEFGSRTRAAETRAAQAIGRLLSVATECLERHNIFVLERERVLNGMRTFLACLVRRVVPGAGANFIAQLPSQLHDELLAQPAGPDVGINLALIERAIRRSMKLSDGQVVPAVEALAEAVTLFVTPGETRSLISQLPRGLRALFQSAQAEEQLKAAS